MQLLYDARKKSHLLLQLRAYYQIPVHHCSIALYTWSSTQSAIQQIIHYLTSKQA